MALVHKDWGDCDVMALVHKKIGETATLRHRYTVRLGDWDVMRLIHRGTGTS